MDSRLLISHLLFILLVSEVVLILPEIYDNLNSFVRMNSNLDSKALTVVRIDGETEASCKISEPPNLLLFERCGLFERIVGYKLQQFGTVLLEDKSGDIMHAIELDQQMQFGMCREVFKRWLHGRGKQPITWATLINILGQVKLRELAAEIQGYISNEVLNIPVSPSSFMYSETITNAANVLKSKYRDQLVIEFNPLHNPSMPFVNLTMMIYDRRVTLSKILKDLNLNISQRILITGSPGAGKTTLLRYLAKEWAEGRALQSCQILFLIHLGHLQKRNTSNVDSLTDLLTASYKDLMGIKPLAEEITAQLGAGACFLIDAYDEWYNHQDFMKNLMFQNHLKHSLRILTSRTEYESNFKTGVKRVSVIGFDAENLEHYLQKLAMNDNRVIQSVLRAWKAHPKVQQMCTLPLHMAMMIAIAKRDIHHSIQTRTQIYTAFMNATIKHYHEFHLDWNSISLRNCILSSSRSEDSGLCTAFKVLHSVAFQMVFNRKNTFPEYDGVKMNIRNLGFVDIVKEDTVWDPDHVRYVFSHPTFLEFFAALHLTTLPQKEQNYYVALYGKGWSFSYSDFWNFFFGLLGDFYLLDSSSVNVSDLLRLSRLRYARKASSGVCEYELEMQFFKLLQEIRWTEKTLCKLLLSANVVVNSSLCMKYTDNVMNKYDFIMDIILKSCAIHRFQLSTRIHNEGLFSYWISVTLENQINTLDEEYSRLVLYINGNNTKCIFPSVTSLHVRTRRMSDHLQLIIRNIMNICINMASLHIEVISEPRHDVAVQRNALLELMMHLNPIQELTLSMDCCLLSAVLGDEGKYVNARCVHLELSKCHFVDGYVYMAKEVWNKYREWISGSISGHISSCNSSYRVVPIDSAFKNLKMLQSLTIDSPSNNGDFKVLLKGLKYLQHFHILSADERTLNQVLEYLSQNPDLKTLEISHASLGNSEIEKLCKYLPQNMLKFGLRYTNLDEYQVRMLSSALKSLDNLTSLDLSADYIDNKSLKYLLSGLKSNRHLRSLDLSFNEINEEHIDLLAQLQTLYHLNIQGYALLPTCKESLMRMFTSLVELQSFYSCFYENRVSHLTSTYSLQLHDVDDEDPDTYQRVAWQWHYQISQLRTCIYNTKN